MAFHLFRTEWDKFFSCRLINLFIKKKKKEKQLMIGLRVAVIKTVSRPKSRRGKEFPDWHLSFIFYFIQVHQVSLSFHLKTPHNMPTPKINQLANYFFRCSHVVALLRTQKDISLYCAHTVFVYLAYFTQ